ncbi:hypothetical protein [Desulfurobacterium crinifex]
MDFSVAQGKTVLVAKNFKNYLANLELLKTLEKKFGIKAKPYSPEAAFRIVRGRKLLNREYRPLGKVTFMGDKDVGYAIYAGGKRIGRAVLIEGELLLHREKDLEPEESRAVDKLFEDIQSLYHRTLNFVVTEKITEVTNHYFKKLGMLPLRPERGDFYLLEDSEKLRDFMKTVEDMNLSTGAPPCFILLKLEPSAIEVIRLSVQERLRSLWKRLESPGESVCFFNNILIEAKSLLKGLSTVGRYIFTDEEREIFQNELKLLTKTAEEKSKRGGE